MRRVDLEPARVAELAAVNPLLEAVAAGLGVSRMTLRRKLRDSAEVRSAYSEGRSRSGMRPRGRPLSPVRTAVAVVEPAAPRFTGAPSVRVLSALAQPGGRTFGELMHDTDLDWHALVETVNRLMLNGRIVARDVCGKRRHFLVGEEAQA